LETRLVAYADGRFRSSQAKVRLGESFETASMRCFN
jgi:hypothetical protein